MKPTVRFFDSQDPDVEQVSNSQLTVAFGYAKTLHLACIFSFSFTTICSVISSSGFPLKIFRKDVKLLNMNDLTKCLPLKF